MIVFTSSDPPDISSRTAAIMTTESRPPRPHRHPGLRALLVAGTAGVLAVLLVTALAAVLDGTTAAVGALVGGGAAVVVFGVGTATVHLVSEVLPGASLLVALLTYTLQLVALMALVAALAGSEVASSDAGRTWFAVALITATFGWLGAQVWQATRARIPAYEAGAR